MKDPDFRETCVVLLLLQHTGVALEISAPNKHQATVGSPALIPCSYTVQKPPVDPKFFAAFWYLEGKQILSYNDEVRTTDPRYSLDIEKALNGRVDLSISKTALSDAGVYACSVLYSPVEKTKDITVYVTAPPQMTITNKTVVLNEESALCCSVTGFYPMDIGIKWFRGREMLGDVTVDEPQRNSDGSYSVNSSMTITPTEEDREQNFSCRVQHESLKKPLQEDFQLLYRVYRDNVMPDYQSLLIAVVIGIIIAAVGILAIIFAVVLYWNKHKRIRNQHAADEQRRDNHDMGAEQASSTTAARVTPTSTPISHANIRASQTQALQGTLPDLEIGEINVPELILGKTATLTCRLYNYILGVHTVEWFEESAVRGEQRAVNDSRRLRTIDEQSEDKRICTANLTLTPVTRTDDGITYICRVKTSNTQKTIEKKTERLHVKETPEERTTEERRTEGGRRPLLVNESIHEEKQKTSAELETDLLGERDNQDCTPVQKNGKSKGSCPAKELSGEEGDEERPSPTNEPCGEEETDHLEESSTREDEELKKEKKENKEISQFINNPFNEQETDKSKEPSTREDEEENNEKEGEETSQVINNPFNEQGTDESKEPSTREDEEENNKKEEENEETSQVINNPFNEQETDESKEPSTREDEAENNEKESEETSQVINNPSNEKQAEQEETSEEVRRDNSGGLCPSGELPQEDNEETSLLSNQEKPRAGLKERSPHEMEIKSSDGLCAANQLSEEEDDESKPLNNTISD